MKVHASQVLHCFGVSNPDPSNTWATKLEDVWNEHGFVEHFHMASREVQIFGHVLPGASTLSVKKHFQRYLYGNNPESSEARIRFMSLSSTTSSGHRKVIQKPGCTAKEVEASATQFKPGYWCFLVPASEKYLVECNLPANLFGKLDIVALQMVLIFKCHISHPIFLATEPLTLGQIEDTRKTLPHPRYIRDKEIAHQYHIGKQLTVYSQLNLPVD